MSVDQRNHSVIQLAARIAAYRKGIDAQEAKAAACAVDFLRRSGSRLPVTTEEAAGLDPRVRQACRVLCATWRKFAVGKCLGRCEQAIRALESVPQDAFCIKRGASRTAAGPICGWSPIGPRGVCTKRDWRRIAKR
jgi:hypothetical protein